MFDTSMVTSMKIWFEIEFEIEIISLAILNNFLTSISSISLLYCFGTYTLITVTIASCG